MGGEPPNITHHLPRTGLQVFCLRVRCALLSGASRLNLLVEIPVDPSPPPQGGCPETGLSSGSLSDQRKRQKFLISNMCQKCPVLSVFFWCIFEGKKLSQKRHNRSPFPPQRAEPEESVFPNHWDPGTPKAGGLASLDTWLFL